MQGKHRAFALPQELVGNEKANRGAVGFLWQVVELAGIEPASASLLRADLHV